MTREQEVCQPELFMSGKVALIVAAPHKPEIESLSDQ